MPKGASFDVKRFYAALDTARSAKGLQWREVAASSGVAASTFSRMAQGKRPDVNGFSALVQWADLDANEFIGNAERAASTTAAVDALLRGDPALTEDNAVALAKIFKTLYSVLRSKA